ncbi:MAG: hypothetical protein AMJ79_14035, partial [Phycisphaerae bacterium SM23_30]
MNFAGVIEKFCKGVPLLTEEVIKAKLIVQAVERMAPLPVLLGRLAGREGIFMLGDFGWRGAGRF